MILDNPWTDLRELEEFSVVSVRGPDPPARVVEGLDVDGLSHQRKGHVHQAAVKSLERGRHWKIKTASNLPF